MKGYDDIVVGAGMGGLAAAITLAAAGRQVLLLEAGPHLGGKVSTAAVDGVTFDTGPSVLTLPDVIDRVLRTAGMSMADLPLVRASPAFRYHFDDRSMIDIHVDIEDTLSSIEQACGAVARREFAGFLRGAKAIWDASKDHFVFAPAPSLLTLVGLALSRPIDLIRVDALRSMARAIHSQVHDPRLRLLLLRYATYNGSNPYVAPATLNCIAHVELGLGAFGVQGGMSELTRVLGEAALRVGVEMRLRSPVTSLLDTGDFGDGIDLGGVVVGGETIRAHNVIVNADVAHLREQLLPSVSSRLPKPMPASMSGATVVVKARRRATRIAHEVVFSADYLSECDDLFEHLRPPSAPTIYLCAQEKAHQRQGWDDHEPVFVMINAPALEAGVVDHSGSCIDGAIATLRQRGFLDEDDQVVWTRTATGLAAQFLGSRGSLYGAASNDRSSAFRRPPNRIRAGLYCASGSAHPGGGVPLCIQSGLLAAAAIVEDDR
jgi:1-hydroxycarotenoid 3,4-desaturase